MGGGSGWGHRGFRPVWGGLFRHDAICRLPRDLVDGKASVGRSLCESWRVQRLSSKRSSDLAGLAGVRSLAGDAAQIVEDLGSSAIVPWELKPLDRLTMRIQFALGRELVVGLGAGRN